MSDPDIDGERSGLGEPWHQAPKHPKHIHDSQDDIVAVTFTEPNAVRVAAAVNAVAGLPTELLNAGVIAQAFEHLMALYRKRRPDHE